MSNFERIIEKSVRDKRYAQDFEQIKKIGRGGYASVYKAKNVLDDQLYAVKKITLKIKDSKSNIEEEIERVLQEAKVLAKVNHPNVLRYYNSWLEIQQKDEKEIDDLPERISKPSQKQKESHELKFSRDYEEAESFSDDDNIVFSNDDEPSEAKQDFSSKKEKNEQEWSSDDDNTVIRRQYPSFQLQRREKNFGTHDKKQNGKFEIQKQFALNSSKKNKIKNNFTETQLRIDGELDENPKAKGKPGFDLLGKEPRFHRNNLSFDSKATPTKEERPRSKVIVGAEFGSPLNRAHSLQYPEPYRDPFESIKSITLYIQTELCKNTLEDYITERNNEFERKKKSPALKALKERKLKEAIKLALQIVNGLNYIHNVAQMIHRDLKPGNILMTEDNIPKIGDFGLVKKIKCFSPLQPSPMLSGIPTPERNNSFVDQEKSESFTLDDKNCEFELKIGDNNQLSCAEEDSPSSNESFDNSGDQNLLQSPQITKAKLDGLDNSKPEITLDVGTKTFASPEQLSADSSIFDERSDIWSLGIIFFLLFHPMVTVMEQTHAINHSKKGILPEKFEKEHPQLAGLVKRMLSKDPTERPLLKEIEAELKRPDEVPKKYFGKVFIRREGSETWKDRWIKIAEDAIYLYKNQNDNKANKILILNEWRISLQNEEAKENSSCNEKQTDRSEVEENASKNQKGPVSFISIENPVQLGYFVATNNLSTTEQVYEHMKNYTSPTSL